MLPKDPMLLFSVVNTRLRDEYASLDELCTAEDVDQQTLCNTLQEIGMFYDPAQNQFK
ncbi:MAG: DUF4250 domain-containing protein [Oscillibacter sp.]|nr:DUF4250 domain-containing protein [Oscillibacter sp.]